MEQQEAKRKFITTCKIYSLNKMNMPSFEIDYAKSIGLYDETIKQTIQKYYKVEL